MLNEKPTDTVQWKKRLEDLDSLPGEEITGRHAAWEKLHNRLLEKPRRKKTAWYWAAACLLLLAAFPFLVNNTGTQLPVEDLVQQKQVSHPAAPVVATAADRPVFTTSIPALKKKTRRITIKRNEHSIIKNSTNQQEAMTITAPKPGTMTSQTTEDNPGNGIVLAATVPAKKKLPVVHINELGKHEQENAPFATHNQWPSRQIKFFNQDNYSSSFIPSTHAAQDMLKIKIPLKN